MSSGSSSSERPRHIDVLGCKVAEGDAIAAEGPTPTQENTRFHHHILPQGEPLSKRRGSESLSIGIPSGSAGTSRPGSKAGSVEVTPMQTPNLAIRRSGTIKSGRSGSASGGARPPIARQLAGTDASRSSSSAVVADDDSDEEGYDGEREPEDSPYTKKSGSAFNNGSHHHQHSSSSTAAATSSEGAAHHRGTSHYGYVRGGGGKPQSNGSGYYNDAHSLHGSQPVRNHHHRSSTTSSIASNTSRWDDKNMKPFPTPGAKGDPNRNPFEEDKSFEEVRLDEAEAKTKHWKRWGPYLSERQWVSATSSVPFLLS